MDDLETAVRLNAALEAAGHRHRDGLLARRRARQVLRRETPDLVILTGAVHEPPARQLAALAREPRSRRWRCSSRPTSTRAERDAPRDRRHRDRGEAGQPGGGGATSPSGSSSGGGCSSAPASSARAPPIQEVLVKIEQMAPVSSTVLIQGESGTGKELVAKAIHDLSPRRGKPFIAVNCAALPETLLESRSCSATRRAPSPAPRSGGWAGSSWPTPGRSSSTRSARSRASVQVKLLRVLETRAFFRVGGVQPIKVDVRVVAATNRTLRDAVALGEFRDDLYYRLNVLNIYLPPLRERRGGHPAPGPAVHPGVRPGPRPALPGHHPGGACSAWSRRPGRAMCGSSGT